MAQQYDTAIIQGLIEKVHVMTGDGGANILSHSQKRSELQRLSQKLAANLEPPEDAVIKQAFTNNVNMCIRVCIDLGIFKLLAASPTPLSTSDLALETNAEHQLLVRLLRAVAGVNFVREVDVKQYEANAITRAIATTSLEAGFGVGFDNSVRPKSNLWEFVKFFRENGYQTPKDPKNGPYQKANVCVGVNIFEHWMRDPQEARRYNTFMHGVRGSRPTWSQWFPVEDLLKEDSYQGGNEDVLLVDVAGGHGHQLQEFATKYPSIQGRWILQDLQAVLDEETHVELNERIEKMPIDFFQKQPVMEAKFYVLSYIMHDWPDEECQRILKNTRDAMRPGYSRVLINDAILADRDCSPLASAFDITMMCHHCGLERTEAMWRDLIDGVDGLEVVKFWYPPVAGEGVLEVMRKS